MFDIDNYPELESYICMFNRIIQQAMLRESKNHYEDIIKKWEEIDIEQELLNNLKNNFL